MIVLIAIGIALITTIVCFFVYIKIKMAKRYKTMAELNRGDR